MNYERMKEIRTYFDNTQKQLADYLNVSRSTYAGWENGIDSIPLLKLNEFCNYYKISLDKNLKEIRLKNNNTQKEISKIIKVDQSNYSKYESGKVLIQTYSIVEFAKHYNVSIDWICGKTK